MEQNQLYEIIRQRIDENGRITFADYMAACLYEPGVGYYTSPGRKVGAQGDFYTSITVHAAFGRVIARELAAMWRSMGQPADFQLMEVGAGHGRLACDILDFLQEREPECYASLSLTLVEKSPLCRLSSRSNWPFMPRSCTGTPLKNRHLPQVSAG